MMTQFLSKYCRSKMRKPFGRKTYRSFSIEQANEQSYYKRKSAPALER